MSWVKCRFEPLDVLVTADARPLEDGGWGQAGAIYPTAFAGALRTLILRKADYDFSKPFDRQSAAAQAAAQSVGMPGAGGQTMFRFAGPFLASPKSDLLFPIPRMCLRDSKFVSKAPAAAPAAASPLMDEACAGLRILAAPYSATEEDRRLVGASHLCSLLSGDPQFTTGNRMESKDAFKVERRFGHTRTNQGIAENGKLFSRATLRFEEDEHPPAFRKGGFVGFAAEETLTPGMDEIVRLGGDGRLARLTVEAAGTTGATFDSLKAVVKERMAEMKGLLLYLATPAIFEKGWKPDFGEESGLRLMAAAVGTPEIVAGWDLQPRPRPRPPYRAAPAGSTYFYQIADLTKAAAFVDKYHFADSVSWKYPELGYGLALTGLWDARTLENVQNEGGNS